MAAWVEQRRTRRQDPERMHEPESRPFLPPGPISLIRSRRSSTGSTAPPGARSAEMLELWPYLDCITRYVRPDP